MYLKLCDNPVNFGNDVRINVIDKHIIRSVLLSTTSSTYKETFASSPVVERFKKESITGFFVHRDKKKGGIVERWSLVEVRLYY